MKPISFQLKFLALLLAIAIGAALQGCSSMGNAPVGNDDAAKDVMKNGTYEQKKDLIDRAPIPPEERQKKLDELNAKMGK